MPTDFTPFASLGGGILIGIASVLLMANFGRVMGA
ncbi:YeeE/YedE family protein, partial [Octadecabacter sp.]|nr:YeeE/YedE family protein [Octadecabacter sp.]